MPAATFFCKRSAERQLAYLYTMYSTPPVIGYGSRKEAAKNNDANMCLKTLRTV
jgi:hypothetical protein